MARRTSLAFIAVSFALLFWTDLVVSAKTPPSSFLPRVSTLTSTAAKSSPRMDNNVHVNINRALAIRGGDHLDPTDTAKIGAVLAGTEAVLTLMSPSRMFEVYGATKAPTPLAELLAQWQATTILSFVLQSWSLIFSKANLQESVALYCIPWTIMQYKTFWNEDHKKIGYPLGPQLVNALLAPLTLYACRTDASFANVLIQACALWITANGLLLILSPGTACDAYGVETSEENKASVKTLGFFCMGAAIFFTLMAFSDVDPVRAFGFAWTPTIVMQLSNNFLTNGPSFAWTLVDVIVVLVCGFQIG